MTEDRPFHSDIKVVTRSYGVSNDPAHAGRTCAVASYAPQEAKILMPSDPRFVSVGSADIITVIEER